MSRSRWLALAVGVLAFTISSPGLVIAATQDAGTVGIRLLDAPQTRADDPRARVYIVDHLAPGSAISRRVEVGNDTAETQRIELYAGSATVEEAKFRFGDGRAPNELTSWTKVTPTSLTLAPGKRGLATVTVTVPRDATGGERYGVVWAGTQAAPTEQAGIGAVNRVGIRMYISVGAGGEPATDFQITDLEGRRDEKGSPVVAALVRNIGGRAVDLTGDLSLTNGRGGLSAGPVSADLGTTIRPGQSGPVLFTLDPALPNGPWDAEITMRSGTTERQARGTVTFPDEAGGVGEGGLEGRRWVLWLGLLLLALVLAFLFFFLWRKRRQKGETAGQAAQVFQG